MNISQLKELTVTNARKLAIHLDFVILISITAYFIPFFNLKSTIDPVLTPRYLALGVAIFTLLILFVIRQHRKPIKNDYSVLRRRVYLFFFLYFIISLISLSKAENISEGIYESLKIFLFLAYLFIATTVLCRDKQYITLTCKAIIFSAAILSAMSIYQYFHFAFFRTGDDVLYSVRATMAHKNQLSSALLLMLPFCLYGTLVLPVLWKIASSLCAISLLYNILSLQTRSVWVAFLVATISTIFIYIFLHKNLRRSKGTEKKLWAVWLPILAIGLVAISLFTHLYLKSNPVNSLTRRFKAIYRRSYTKDISVEGVVNNCLAFNGMTDYILIESNPIPSSGGWTVSGWAYCDGKLESGSDKWAVFFSSFRTIGTSIKGVNAHMNSGNLNITVGNGIRDRTLLLIEDITGSNANKWYHIAIAYSSDQKQVKTYINGSYRSQMRIPYEDGGTGFSIGNKKNLSVGNSYWYGRTSYWYGRIDEIAVYERALSEAEIDRVYNGLLDIDNAELLGHWNMNDNISTTLVEDNSLHKRHGKLFGKEPGDTGRLNVWRNSLRMIYNNLLVGVGVGNWKIIIPSYGLGRTSGSTFDTVHFQRPHNDYIWVLSEIGLFGFISYLLIFATAFYYIFKIIIHSSDLKDKLFSVFLFYGIVSYMIISFFSFPKERIFPTVILMLMFAIATSIYHNSSKPGKAVSQRFGFGVIAVSIVLLLFVIANGYLRLTSEIHTKKALRAREAQNWPVVIKEIDRAHTRFVTLDPTAAPLLWYRGEANYLSGNISQALEDYQKAYKAHPYHIYVLNNLATCYELGGEHNEAINYYKKALKIQPQFEDALINLSAIYYTLGKYEKAYETLMQCEPNTQNNRFKEYKEIFRKTLDKNEHLK